MVSIERVRELMSADWNPKWPVLIDPMATDDNSIAVLEFQADSGFYGVIVQRREI